MPATSSAFGDQHSHAYRHERLVGRVCSGDGFGGVAFACVEVARREVREGRSRSRRGDKRRTAERAGSGDCVDGDRDGRRKIAKADRNSRTQEFRSNG